MVVRAERRWCQSCGVALSRAAGLGVRGLCRVCERVTAAGFRPPVPPDFHRSAELRRALGGHDFGMVFREVRCYCDGMSQEELAFLVGLTQDSVSKVERGVRRLDKFADVIRVVTALGIPAQLLNLARAPASGDEEGTVGWVDRRGFHKALAAAALGVGATLELDRLTALLPAAGQEPPPQRIGAADVAAINQATDTFRLSHYEHGGGLARAAAVAQLGYVLNLRNAQCSDQVRAELLIATAALANTAGWMNVEAARHEDAQRLFMIALSTARESEHPHSTDLMVETLMNTSVQTLHLGQPREATSLAQYATMLTATDTNAPVSAATRSLIPANLGVSQAVLGEAEKCRRSLEELGQIITDPGADPAGTPPWVARVSAATYSDRSGRALFQLSVTDPSYAPEAIEHLTSALDGYDPGRVTARARCLPALAGSYVQADDLDTALTHGHQAVTVADGLSSTIPHLWLHTLDDVLEPHQHRTDVTELRHRIHQTTAPATV